MSEGKLMYDLADRLFPICRSLTGEGVRETLINLQQNLFHIPLKMIEVPSGTKCFDWTVPQEWNIRDGWIKDIDGNKIVDFKKNNLHVMGYSEPVDKIIDRKDLSPYIHTLPEYPSAIPYKTSYYDRTWGFCMSYDQWMNMEDDGYKVYIDSDLKDGHMTYGEVIIPGETEEEIFISTYICHPSMANDNLSGPVLATYLIKWIASQPRKYTYRIIFIPETIGSIYYLSQGYQDYSAHYQNCQKLYYLQEHMKAGFVLSCVGDDGDYSMLESRIGNTYADDIVCHVFNNDGLNLKTRHFYSYLQRGSDERQYCAPGIDLPVVTISRSKFNTYKEYHTSEDNMDFISPEGFQGSYDLMVRIFECIEMDEPLQTKILCEPHMGESANDIRDTMNLISYADGRTVLEIAEGIGVPMWALKDGISKLKERGIL